MFRRTFCKLGATGLVSLAVYRQINALQKVTASSAKKWAIVYGSKCGSTKQVAEWINEGMDDVAELLDVEDSPDVNAYDYFVIGGWINSSQASGNKLIDTVADFVKNNKQVLQSKIMGLFTVCGNGGAPVEDAQISEYLTNQIVEFSGVSDKPAKLFNGKNDHICGVSYFAEYNLLDQDTAVEFGKEIFENFKVAIRNSSLTPSPAQIGLTLKQGTGAKLNNEIVYNIPAAGHVKLTICSIHGQKLATLVSQYQNAGSYRVPIGGRNLTPGHYICRLEAAGIVKTVTTTIVQ